MYADNYGTRFREPGDFFFEWDTQTRQVRFAGYINALMAAANEMAVFLRI
jgi:hypothetical protein